MCWNIFSVNAWKQSWCNQQMILTKVKSGTFFKFHKILDTIYNCKQHKPQSFCSFMMITHKFITCRLFMNHEEWCDLIMTYRPNVYAWNIKQAGLVVWSVFSCPQRLDRPPSSFRIHLLAYCLMVTQTRTSSWKKYCTIIATHRMHLESKLLFLKWENARPAWEFHLLQSVLDNTS